MIAQRNQLKEPIRTLLIILGTLSVALGVLGMFLPVLPTTSFLLLWLTIGSTSWLTVSQWWMQLILFGITVGVTVHLVKIKTYKPKTPPCSLLREYNSDEDIV
jgi:uncharacterized membrane protein YbaN (DUF454 family)